MKIAFCSQEYPPETAHGGIATQTRAKALGMAALGHEVVVVSHSTTGLRTESRDGPVTVIRIPGSDAALPGMTEPVRWLTYSALVAAELDSLQRQAGIEVADFPEWGGEAYVHLLNQAPWRHLPTVVHLQGPLVMLAGTIGWPEPGGELHRQGRLMEETCLRLADRVISSSRCSARWCASQYGAVAGAEIAVLHTGVDIERFLPAPEGRADGREIVFVGRVAASKGVDTLVEAACRLVPEFPGLRLRLVGRADPRFAAALRKCAQDAGAAGLLDFVGFVGAEALPQQLQRADIFASPSRYEGGPCFSCLEAMACGLPVVACSGSGVEEIIEDERTGLLVPPGDAQLLADSLRQLLGNSGLRQRLGEAARRYVEREADSRACIRRFEQVYLSLVKGRP
jgi:glycosyltransferase involved in cell wall biosynthesis